MWLNQRRNSFFELSDQGRIGLELFFGRDLKKKLIAVVVPMTSMKTNLTQPEKSPLFRLALPSIVKTLQTDLDVYDVHVYAGFDATDPFWHDVAPADRMVGRIGVRFIECACTSMVCNTNCVARRAYGDGAEYILRSNDDTEFSTVDWGSKLAAALWGLNPPNVGVVGPVCRQGNTKILTHDFTHRTHLEIMNMDYYPSVFENWFCDDWSGS